MKTFASFRARSRRSFAKRNPLVTLLLLQALSFGQRRARSTGKPRSRRAAAFQCVRLAAIPLLASLAIIRATAQEMRDDFNDGDDTGWTRHSPLASLGSPAHFSFSRGGYRISTTAPSPNPEMLGPGRVYSTRPEVYSDFYIEVDVVSWDNNLPQSFGILARVGTPGLGTTTGYALSWDRGDVPGDGNVDLVRIDGERTTHLSITGEEDIQLTPGKPYRFVFVGRGPSLEGRIYELPDTARAKVAVTASDHTYTSGRAGLLAVDDSEALDRTVDVTFDNFSARDRETSSPPPVVSYRLTIPHGFSSVANHFDRGANIVAELLPNVPEGTLLYKFDSARQIYTVSQFQWGTWTRPDETLAPGEGAFIHNPGVEFSITFTGAPPMSAQIPKLNGGLNLISLPVLGESSMPAAKEGDRITRFDMSRKSFQHHIFDGLDRDWIPRIQQAIQVGESFFYQNTAEAVSSNAVSGGTIYFSTYLPGEVNAPVLSSESIGISDGYNAQLYAAPAGTPVDDLSPLFPITSFQTSAAGAGYVEPAVVSVPGMAPGQQGTVLMRVFDGASWETSTHRGQSAPILITLGGGVLPPSQLADLPGFSLLSPRPAAGQIRFERTSNGLILSYTGILQVSDSVSGPYSDVAGAVSPISITFDKKVKFYRLKP